MNRFFAMDTSFFHTLGNYPFDTRCEMLAELGYEGTYLTLWSDAAWANVSRLGEVHARYGLEVAAVYLTLDLGDEQAARAKLADLIQRLEGTRTIEIALRHSKAPRIENDDAAQVLQMQQVDDQACRLLESLLPDAQQRDIQLLLYPHMRFHVERLDHATRLCRRLAHPHLGMVLPMFHWYAVDGKDLQAKVRAAGDWLRMVNLCGSRRNPPASAMPASIECLDEGELDNFAVLGLLREIGYDGWIGVQGYSNGGDVYAKLRRSLDAYRDMCHRLDAHPHWARLN